MQPGINTCCNRCQDGHSGAIAATSGRSRIRRPGQRVESKYQQLVDSWMQLEVKQQGYMHLI